MDRGLWRKLTCIALLSSSTLCVAQNSAITYRTPLFMRQPAAPAAPSVPGISPSPESSTQGLEISTQPLPERGDGLALWTFSIKGSRDGNQHTGAIIGRNPFTQAGTAKVATYIVPLIIRTHRIATTMDPRTFVFTTVPGDTTVDATAQDNVCLTAPNNVPATLVRRSPVFESSKFVFGATDIGTTQYLDAFQRASFWTALGSRTDSYHVLLDPVRTLDPVVIDAPANEGVAITDPQFFVASFGATFCPPLQLIDQVWFDSYLKGTVIPALQREDVGPASLPIFVSYDAVWSGNVAAFNCCEVGYHSSAGTPIPTQTYVVTHFDRSQLFGGPGGLDIENLSHEIGEWANDPFLVNATAPWGHTGQVSGCQANMEVADPLMGHDLAPVPMPNGFTYHVQELAFFSWFFGAPSVGANGWYSNNGTFLRDAGPLCP